MKRILIAAALLFACSSAQARPHHHHHRHHHHAHQHAVGQVRCTSTCAVVLHDRRPSAWCGWYMRQILGVADQAYNLARNWAHWGRPSSPGRGVVVVWSHHVGMITGRDASGNWIVKSGNDGHRVRERPRSVAGAIAFRSAS